MEAHRAVTPHTGQANGKTPPSPFFQLAATPLEASSDNLNVFFLYFKYVIIFHVAFQPLRKNFRFFLCDFS